MFTNLIAVSSAMKRRFPSSLSLFVKTSATPAINEVNPLILNENNLAGEQNWCHCSFMAAMTGTKRPPVSVSSCSIRC